MCSTHKDIYYETYYETMTMTKQQHPTVQVYQCTGGEKGRSVIELVFSVPPPQGVVPVLYIHDIQ